MKPISIFLFISISLMNIVFAQQVKIKKVLDANLFELEDGKKIKLAGIDLPNLDYPAAFLKNIAEESVTFSNENLKGRSFFLKTLAVRDSFDLVILKSKYLFDSLLINSKFLTFGFGKFIDNISDSSKSEMLAEQEYAIKGKKGIWKYYSPVSTDTLDKDLTGEKKIKFIPVDTLKIISIVSPRSLENVLPLELLVGSGMSAACIFGGLLAGAGLSAIISPNDTWSAFGYSYLGILAGYAIGYPTGVFLVARHDNPNLSWWEITGVTLGLSLITTTASIIVTHGGTNNKYSWIWWTAGLSPIVGSLSYVHLFPPANQTREEAMQKYFGNNKISSLKDYYNEAMSFKIELFRINF